MTKQIRVALVDDHALCRNGLTELLEHCGGMKVVGTTGNPDEVGPMLISNPICWCSIGACQPPTG